MIGAIVIAGLTIAHAGRAHTTGVHDRPWLENHGQVFRERAWNKIRRLRAVKHQLCRPAPMFRRPGVAHPGWRRHRLDWLSFRVVRARGYGSRCERARAHAWATSSAGRCVSSKEGGVTTNTGNGYYGKWQADLSFQTTYGGEFYRRWGVASNWPEWAQDIMGYRGWQARGWYPWPTTGRICGLL